MAASIQDAIFYLDAWNSYGVLARRTHPAEERVPTFTRSGDAYFTDSSDTLRVAGSNIIRPDYVTANDGTTYRGLTLELSRQQLLTAPEDFSDAAWTSTATVTTDDALAPDGSQTADKVEDTSGTSTEYLADGATVPDDSVDRVVSIYVKKEASFDTTAELELRYTGGTLVSYTAQLNPATGSINTSRKTTPTDAGVQDRGDYWRLWIAGANNGTGNTNATLFFRPAINASGADGTGDTSATGAAHFWGANLHEGELPTSYIDSAATRPTEDFYIDGGPDGSVALVGYVRFIAGMRDDGGLFFPGLLTVSDSGFTKPAVLLDWQGPGPLRLVHLDPGGNAQAAPGVNVEVGQLMEAAFHVAGDGTPYMVCAIDEGTAVGDVGGASPNGLQKFSGRRVTLNAEGDQTNKGKSTILRLGFYRAASVDAPLDGTDDAAFMSEMRAVQPTTT